MRYWAAVIPADRFATERLYANDSLTLAVASAGVAAGEPVLLVAAEPEPVVFGLGRVRSVVSPVNGSGEGQVEVRYTRRLFDRLVPAGDLVAGGADSVALVPVEPEAYEKVAAAAGTGRPGRADWLVSVAIPVEADTPAEAVREFWTYVAELGPRELPAYVSPTRDELAMQAYVLGVESNQDPEEDD